MTNSNFKNNKEVEIRIRKQNVVLGIAIIGILLFSSIALIPNAHALTPSQKQQQKAELFKGKIQPNTIVDTVNVYNDDCTQYATETSPCEEYAPGYNMQFFYSSPFSYVDLGSCMNECYDQDTEVVYPSQVTYQGNTYSFSGAIQNECQISNPSNCSPSNEWYSGSSKVVDYINTPAGGISILTVIDYSYNGNIVEYDYWYNLDYGYSL